jgi:hypothetical protein
MKQSKLLLSILTGGLGGYSTAPIIFDLGVGTWTPQVKSGYSMYPLFTTPGYPMLGYVA